MMCRNCRRIADIYTRRRLDMDPRNNTHLNGGGDGTGLRCEYPHTCTCQHEPITKNYIAGNNGDDSGER